MRFFCTVHHQPGLICGLTKLRLHWECFHGQTIRACIVMCSVASEFAATSHEDSIPWLLMKNAPNVGGA